MYSGGEESQRLGELEQVVQKKEAENEQLRAQMSEMMARFKELKLVAERRARLLHHVMEEYNGMTKEYGLMKLETGSIQTRMNDLQQKLATSESQNESLEQNIQFLELENDKLRQTRIIDAPANVWYGECTHSCSRHPRTFATKRLEGQTGGDGVCGTCTEAEQWAEDMLSNPPAFTSSLQKHYEPTLPRRTQLPMISRDDSRYSSLQKPSSREIRTEIRTG